MTLAGGFSYILQKVFVKYKQNDDLATVLFCCRGSRLRILFKSRLRGIHLATLCVLLAWPPDKRTLVLGQCFFQSSFFIFLPHCPAPDKRTYRAHGPAESASSAPASCAYITNPRRVASALWFLRSCIFQLLIKKHSEKCFTAYT